MIIITRLNIQLSDSKNVPSPDLALVQKKLAQVIIVHHTLHQHQILSSFSNLIQVEAENIKLTEENERLSEQVLRSICLLSCRYYAGIFYCILY